MATQLTGQIEMRASREFIKKLLMLAAAGGEAFWVIDFVISISPIAAQYKSAFLISSLSVALVEALIDGMMIALYVSFFLIFSLTGFPAKTQSSRQCSLALLSW